MVVGESHYIHSKIGKVSHRGGIGSEGKLLSRSGRPSVGIRELIVYHGYICRPEGIDNVRVQSLIYLAAPSHESSHIGIVAVEIHVPCKHHFYRDLLRFIL